MEEKKLCCTYKHGKHSSERARQLKYLFYDVYRTINRGFEHSRILHKLHMRAWSVYADDADYDCFFSPSPVFKWFWHHSWIKSTFPWDFLSFLYSCTSSTNLIHQIYLYLLPDDSNQMKSFQIFFYFPAPIWIIIYANFFCWIRIFPLHCAWKVWQKILARKWIEFHICQEHLLSANVLSLHWILWSKAISWKIEQFIE